MDTLPHLIEPAELHQRLGAPGLVLVDLSAGEVYQQGHIPGALPVDYSRCVSTQGRAGGMLPEPPALSALCAGLGLRHDSQVVACDDEQGRKASRFLWTLDVLGHSHHALLNGGRAAWQAEGRPLTTLPAMSPQRSVFHALVNKAPIASRDDILARLHDPDVVLVDARSPAEYRGEDLRAARGGHIPGAVNIEWKTLLDPARGGRFRPADTLLARLTAAGVTPDKLVIVYCQTHRRSALLYYALRHYLAYPRVKGYPGSWSEWGNLPDSPIEH
ncbi:MAG TPA: sulfurtransferase [Gammaproteobacteria bacterium]|nr:sulfurtransferase [Gammaproteobacteria bacterium]